MMSAYGTIDTAVECMKQGAYDYISKPFRPDEILRALRKAESVSAEGPGETSAARQPAPQRPTAGDGGDRPPQCAHAELLETVRRTAASQVPVLITGRPAPAGTVARALHAESPRCGRPFLALNCGAIPAGCSRSELFGHVRGPSPAPTGPAPAVSARRTAVPCCSTRSAICRWNCQPKLLRVLQEGEVRRVGDNHPWPVDVRVVGSYRHRSWRPRQWPQGAFARIFYYRLAVVTIELPPLRRRPLGPSPPGCAAACRTWLPARPAGNRN